MQTKNNRLTNIIVISLLFLATIVSIGFYFSQPQAVALAGDGPTQQPLSEKPAEVVTTAIASQEILSETHNDITVEITSTQIISTGIEIGICYTAPDDGEWRPLPGHLFYGKYDVYPDEIEFLADEILADGKNTGTRCAFVRYLIDDLNTVTVPVTFSILRFYAPGREMYGPCEELQQRLDTNPKAQSYELKMKCEVRDDGSTDVVLLSHNKSISTDDVQKALDVIASAEIYGDWEFTINDIKK